MNLTAIRFLREMFRRFGEDQGAVLAGYIAYSAMLSSMPFLIFTITFAGIVVGERYSNEAVELLFNAVPEHVARTLEPVLNEVLTVRGNSVLTLSALGTIYAASNGVEAVRIGLDRAYDIEAPRNFLLNRAISIGVVVLGFIVFGLLALLIVFAPLAFQLLEALTTIQIPAGAAIARYLVGAMLLYGFLWLLHHILPARPMWKKTVWPGIFVSIMLWIVMASAVSLYVSLTPSYSLTYGALTGVIVTLLFFYLTGVAIILGAEVNAVLNFGLAEEVPEHEPKPKIAGLVPGHPPGDAQDDQRP